MLGKIHDNPEVKMVLDLPSGKSIEREKDFLACKDFLCQPESYISEWFPDPQSGRLRAKAIDPYGLMVGKLISTGDQYCLRYKCKYEHCHVKIWLRKKSKCM